MQDENYIGLVVYWEGTTDVGESVQIEGKFHGEESKFVFSSQTYLPLSEDIFLKAVNVTKIDAQNINLNTKELIGARNVVILAPKRNR